MKTLKQACIAVLLLCSQALTAQDLIGDWQGDLNGDGNQFRFIVHIKKGKPGEPKVTISDIDRLGDWGSRFDADSASVQGSLFKLAIEEFEGNFEGILAADGKSIVGAWSGRGAQPLTLVRETSANAWKDIAHHSLQFVTVDKGVKLEVLDWGGPAGGKARTLVLLAGLGNTAHVFDDFATKLTSQYHVIGITRRGFGRSSAPESGYEADRLGDDVLAVMAALKLNKPVLAGHSIAGSEMSSIGSRYPDKVAGLIYLEAAWVYAYYSPEGEPWWEPAKNKPTDARSYVDAGIQKYTHIPVPALALYALPREPQDDASPAEWAKAAKDFEHQADEFEKGVPTARVVRIAHANHYIFLSKEADVLREMNAFIASLK